MFMMSDVFVTGPRSIRRAVSHARQYSLDSTLATERANAVPDAPRYSTSLRRQLAHLRRVATGPVARPRDLIVLALIGCSVAEIDVVAAASERFDQRLVIEFRGARAGRDEGYPDEDAEPRSRKTATSAFSAPHVTISSR
jgi:hypothetical protein